LNLDPLTVSQAGRVIREYGADRTVHDDFVEVCHHVSAGNPFLLNQLLQRLRSEGVKGTAADAEAVASVRPQAVSRWIVSRLGALGEAARELAFAYAVLGTGASLHDAAVLAELTDEAAAIAADALIREHILGPSRPYDFEHPLVAAAVYEAIPSARRALSHRRAARLREERGAAPALVAAHLLASEPVGDPWAAGRLERAAAEAVASGAPAAAITYLERALAEGGNQAAQARLLRELGVVQQHTSLHDSLRTMRAALELETDRVRRTEIFLTMGRASFAHGAIDKAHDLFLAGLEEIGDDASDLSFELSAWSAIDTDHEPTIQSELRPRLEALLRGDSLPETRIERLMLAFFALRATGTGERSASTAAELARRALGNGALLADCIVDFAPHTAACSALLRTTRLEEALAASDAALLASRRRGSRRAVGWFAFLRGSVHFACGNLLQSSADLEEACAASLEVGGQVNPQMAAVLACVWVERGNRAAACELLDSITDAPARSVSMRSANIYWHAVGRLRAAEGNLGAALQAYIRSEGEAYAVQPIGYPGWRAEAAVTAVRLEQPARAREVMGDALERARAFGDPGALGVLLRAQGVIEGDRRGIELLEESVATLEMAGCRMQLARSLVELGSALRRAGHRNDAIATLKDALDTATTCAAALDAARARVELNAAGAKPRRERTTGPAALTAREMHVATMAAEGSSNPQIAQDLFVTLRTVETHLTSIYRKLDVSGRRELGAALGPSPALV
jgi:DNA-binding CsgD family transcriptional regulator/tetratricopeptide (TPR) repeat protein